ncbi:MAG: hypothetical protein WBX01_07710 [Nitrososphaeraceae archaeon]
MNQRKNASKYVIGVIIAAVLVSVNSLTIIQERIFKYSRSTN